MLSNWSVCLSAARVAYFAYFDALKDIEGFEFGLFEGILANSPALDAIMFELHFFGTPKQWVSEFSVLHRAGFLPYSVNNGRYFVADSFEDCIKKNCNGALQEFYFKRAGMAD